MRMILKKMVGVPATVVTYHIGRFFYEASLLFHSDTLRHWAAAAMAKSLLASIWCEYNFWVEVNAVAADEEGWT